MSSPERDVDDRPSCALRRTTRRALAALALVAATAGCYRTTPVVQPTPGSGVEVVIDLTDAGSVQLTPTIGARIERVRGMVDGADEGALSLLMRASTNRTGAEERWQGERVVIRREYIASLRERRIDRGRSTLLALLLVAGVVIAGGALTGEGGISGFFGGGGGARQ